MLRGTLIQPGKTFSVNDAIGRRTADKGFVAAPVIEEGRFAESIGGGISQFATTLFNAAFEAGLDFGSYQSHSIYISRYPYGREATLSYPAPDLEIENSSPHGVLIWPTYNDTSITVTLYSTKFADVKQTGQSQAPRGNCTRVTTERTRTWLSDGRTTVDKVFATYRPAEGVNC
jgi:vancomycin resistance protein YoaR